MSNSFKRLILKYANGRKICNCGSAYRNAEGNCKYGCSANQIFAKEYVAKEAEKEIAALEILLNLKPLTQGTKR